jgi:hypothetical protein
MAVTGSAMPDEKQPPPAIAWPAIRHAVFTMMMHDSEQSVKSVKGNGWTVYRTGNIIRIDIQQGE